LHALGQGFLAGCGIQGARSGLGTIQEKPVYAIVNRGKCSQAFDRLIGQHNTGHTLPRVPILKCKWFHGFIPQK
jgi:hypothetical protein